VETAVEAMRRGAFDFLTKPVSLEKLEILIKRALQSRQVEEENVVLHERLDKKYGFDGIVGNSPSLTDVLDKVKLVAPSKATVLLEGETGTGKELIAQAIHQNSNRARQAFVPVHCAALAANLLESELFGHEKGAYTGASERRIGRFEAADGGTLFLDEIGDMPMEAQTRLLRVLQQGEYTTVGGRVPIRTDVRIVAATNKDLRQLINQGLFREDLYYRLNVVPIRLPPLRERTEDIPDLVRHFFALAEKEGLPVKQIEAAAVDRLRRYRWPGNVRELENLVRRLTALYPQDVISAALIDTELSQPTAPAEEEENAQVDLSGSVERYLNAYFQAFGDALPPPGLYHRILREVEYPLIGAALAATRGNQIKAAELLGVNRNTLRKKIRDLDVQVIRSTR
jgi:two-component system nitrogen regulation response regulator GlnG